MNDLQIFEHTDFGQIRVVERDGEPWFVAADVCRALEISDTSTALQRIDDDEKGTVSTRTPGGEQQLSAVNEPGLYSLVLGSRKPEAKAFKRWITHEVLPAIRETGRYCLVPVTQGVDQRQLTTDDYLKAAVIVANCRNERLPYVLGFLEKGGWEIPRINDTPLPRPPISLLIKQTLKETGMTSKELEHLTGLSHITLSRYKNGHITPRAERYDYLVSVLTNLIPQTE